jgi:HPt (histidine-containing phosphotransfer) domain-containing protein
MQQGMKSAIPQIEILHSTLRGDPDLEALVEMFVDEMPERIAALQQRAEGHDLPGLRRLAHQIKGSGGSHGFQPISDSAAGLEDAIREGLPEETIHRRLLALIDICARARL